VGRKGDDGKRISRRIDAHAAAHLESLGTLAGGIAHDMNNVLASIMVVASAMEAEMQADNPFRADVHDILDACMRGTKLTRGMLHFARRYQIRRRAVALSALVEETARAIASTTSPGVTVSVKPCAEPLEISGDAELLGEAIANVCRNGIDSMANGGILTIETSIVTRGARDCPRGFEVAPGRFARIAVSDTGCGMAPEVMDRAFEPFFSTKQNGKGAGLGLAIAYGAVRKHSGVIEIESAVDAGTTVRIDIPAVPIEQET
jgi:two-component system, cell cycle sensor histidine kinase and response regulator CckA